MGDATAGSGVDGRSPLTTEQEFIVKRLMSKIGSAKHQLHEAILAARSTTTDVLQRNGMIAAARMLEDQAHHLRRYIEGPHTSPSLLKAMFPTRAEPTDG